MGVNLKSKFSRIAIIASLFFSFMGGYLLGVTQPVLHALQDKIYRSLDLFTKAIYLVETEYIEEIDGDKLIYGAVQGMMDTLDPYSIFLTPDVYQELKSDTTGRFGGIGIEITLKDGIVTVVSPLEGSPAAKAGIRPGDRILKINEHSTKGMNLVEASRKLRENKNRRIKLTIWREGLKKPLVISLRRETIQLKSVESKTLTSGAIYIRLTNFQEGSTLELEKKLLEYKSLPKTPIILDLRNNPGGLLSEAVGMANLFLESGVIVSTRGRSGTPKEVQRATEDGVYFTYPLVILINEGSASASEILAAALQENHRAKVIGQTSFGKGSVQTVIDLGEKTGLKLTIAKYYTPKGKSIHGKGIKPDLEVLYEPEHYSHLGVPKKDHQLQAAELYLKTGILKTPRTANKNKKKKSANAEIPIE